MKFRASNRAKRWEFASVMAALVLGSLGMTAADIAAADRNGVLKAWREMQLGRWNNAQAILDGLADSPSDEAACQVRFALGNLWQHRRPGADPAKAERNFAWIVEKHPKDPMAAWALLAAARIPDLDVLRPDLPKAIALYRRVLVEYPDSEAAQEAVLHLVNALFESGKKAGALEGVAAFKRWIAEHPHPGYLPEQELLLGKLLRYPIGDYPQAVAHLSRALDLGLRTLAQQTTTCWAIANLAERELKDRNLAVQYYTRFIKEFPRHRLVYRAKLALKRLGAPVPETEDLSLEGVMKKYGSGANLKSQAPNSK